MAAPLFSQSNSTGLPVSSYLNENTNVNVNIFPVPVKNSTFTITSEKEIIHIKITNIIGQDIFSSRFSEQKSIRITLNNAKRGMYIITITFSDNIRIVKKIMVED
jgi:hypothetical protein